MELVTVIGQLVAVVVILSFVVGRLLLSTTQRHRIRYEFKSRLRIGLPAVAVLAGVLLINALSRTTAQEVSWFVGINVTARIYRLEGEFILLFQRSLAPTLTSVFSYIYVYGYVFLLVFPVVAYFAMRRLDTFQQLTIAYTANYGIGLLCYIVFIAYGPRNMIPELVQAPMYIDYPQFNLLTSRVNEHTNVFPSLHTSLSGTVMYFAWRTRTTFPGWAPIAWVLGIGVMISTMYLGIHWFTDVLAGIGLALLSSWLGVRIQEEGYLTAMSTSIGTWFSRFSPRV